MPKVLAFLGPDTPYILHHNQESTIISSLQFGDAPIPFESVPEETSPPELVILSGHGSIRAGRYVIDLFDFNGPAPDFIEQLYEIQQKTGAKNFCILSCYAGMALRNIEDKLISETDEDANQILNIMMADVKRTADSSKLKFLDGTTITVFGSNRHVALGDKMDAISKRLIENGIGENYEFLATEFGVPYKSLTIVRSHEEVSVIKERSKLFKNPEAYLKAKSGNATDEDGLAMFIKPEEALREVLLHGEFDLARQWFDICKQKEGSTDPAIVQDANFISLAFRYYVPDINDTKSPEKFAELKKLKSDLILRILDPLLPLADKNDLLIFFSKTGETHIVESLLLNGADGNFIDQKGFNALQAATLAGHVDTVDILLQQGKLNDEMVNECLFYACIKVQEKNEQSPKFEAIVFEIIESKSEEKIEELRQELQGKNDPKSQIIKSVLIPLIGQTIERPPSRIESPSILQRPGAPSPSLPKLSY